ncbi:MAG: BMP family ABC transporter substrate-binding protein [Candidatus Schekmanbacteria bacterium]|nr:BMP family ABC transporter substrate-binding protein [Candidatus Schekmanbacteria bacterium]
MKKIYKILPFLLTVVLVALPAHARDFKAIMVTDVAGLGDKSFNDAAWTGLQRAQKDLKIEIACLQSYEQADYISNLNLAAQDGDLVIAMGFLLAEAVQKTAPLHPRKHFIFVDGKIQAPNVASFDYKAEEGAYLAGIIAAAVTKTQTVGIVEGLEIPPVKAFEAGFRAGVKTGNSYFKKNVQVKVVSAGSFNDPSKGKSLSKSLMGQGADIIFQLAGNTGLGVFEAIREQAGVYAIGSDLNQDGLVQSKVLTSVMKKTESAVYSAVKSAKLGRFESGHYYVGLLSGAIDITPLAYTKDLIPADAHKLLAKSREAITGNKLKVPNLVEDVAKFAVPVH